MHAFYSSGSIIPLRLDRGCGRRPSPLPPRLAPPPRAALQVAFTRAGLEALGCPDDHPEGFARIYAGMGGEQSRSRRLGDVGPGAPSQWSWGAAETIPDAWSYLWAGRAHRALETDRGEIVGRRIHFIATELPSADCDRHRAVRFQGRHQSAEDRLVRGLETAGQTGGIQRSRGRG